MPRTALIVDHEHDDNQWMARQLQSLNFEVNQQSCGTSVIEILEDQSPDCLLIAQDLPDRDAVELCRIVKCRPQTSLIPILLLTRRADGPDGLMQLEHGVPDTTRSLVIITEAYLPKPIAPETLAKSVRAAIERRDELRSRGIRTEVRFALRSHHTHLQALNDQLCELYGLTPLTARQIRDLNQALLEMGSNAIEWGHKKNEELLLQVTYRTDDEGITLIIRDQGEGFDRNQLEHAARDDDPLTHLDVRNAMGLREGGFGIMISKGLVNHFAYNEQGNEVTLVKHYRSNDRESTDVDAAEPA